MASSEPAAPRPRSHGAFIGIAAAILMTASCGGDGPGRVAYVGGNLWDGSGGPPVLDAVIIVAEGRIEAAGPPDAVTVPRGAEEVRLDGKWIIPGLIDAHTHIERWTLTRFLFYGVTSVRDVGGENDSVFALRDAAGLGSLASPRLFVAGAAIDPAPTARRGVTAVTGASEARRAVDDRVLRDASLAKVYPRVDRELLAAILDEATTVQLPVAAHLGRVDAVTAARMGVASIEHLSGIAEASVADPGTLFLAHDDFFPGWKAAERAWVTLDSVRIERTALAVKEAGTAVVPTLVLYEALAHLSDAAFLAALDLSGVPDSARHAWDVPALLAIAGITPDDLVTFGQARTVQDRFVRLFKRGGGLIAAGTDTPGPLLVPGASLHDELALLVKAGLTPREALLAATRDAARLLRADTVGVVRAGAVADFIVLSANPLDDIANTRKIETVVVRGAARRPSELRAMWR